METITVNQDSAEHLGLAEAKAGLSGIVTKVQRSGTSYVIERYGRPAAMIVPVPHQGGGSNRARGLLAAYADSGRQALEEGAFARAMEAKHGHVA